MLKYAVIILTCHFSFTSTRYTVPDLTIDVFETNGFRMSLPHHKKLTSVSFHVNINEEINLTSLGQYYADVLHPVNGQWVFEKTGVRVELGDFLSYWVTVYEKKKVYLKQHFRYVVREFSVRDPSTTTTTTRHQPTTPTTRYQPTTPAPSPPPSYALITTPSPIDCSGLITNLSKVVVEMGQQSTLLREENQILRELADKGKYLLRLNSLIVDSGEPEDVVNFVLREKLDIDRKVKSATKVTNHTSIIFEVYSLDEKIHIIKKVKEKLSNSQSIGITYNI